MATVYGSIIKSLWRAYLDYDTTKTDTTVKITASSGFYCYANGYKVSNWSNALSFAGTSVDTASSTSVYVGGTTGSKYKKTSYSKTYTRKTSAYTVVLKGSFVNRYTAGSAPGTSNATVTITIPALSSHTITYNANADDANGSIATQTKYYNNPITLAKIGFTRPNYSLVKWNTEADGTGTDYELGETYPTNSTTDITLYAVWHLEYILPTISKFKCYRCDDFGVENDSEDYCRVEFDYTLGRDPGEDSNELYVAIEIDGVVQAQETLTGKHYTSPIFGDVSSNESYKITVKFSDARVDQFVAAKGEISSSQFPIDILADGSAMGIMCPAVRGRTLTLPGDISLAVDSELESILTAIFGDISAT